MKAFVFVALSTLAGHFAWAQKTDTFTSTFMMCDHECIAACSDVEGKNWQAAKERCFEQNLKPYRLVIRTILNLSEHQIVPFRTSITEHYDNDHTEVVGYSCVKRAGLEKIIDYSFTVYKITDEAGGEQTVAYQGETNPVTSFLSQTTAGAEYETEEEARASCGSITWKTKWRSANSQIGVIGKDNDTLIHLGFDPNDAISIDTKQLSGTEIEISPSAGPLENAAWRFIYHFTDENGFRFRAINLVPTQ